MTKPLPPMGFAEDVLGGLPMSDPADPQPLASFVQAVGPDAFAPAPKPEPQVHLVSFTLGDGAFCAPTDRVREIVRVHHLTRIPQAPPHVRGVQNLRGTVLPVLELRTRLGLSPAQVTDASRVVVAEAQGRLVGLLVDGVQRVTAQPRASVKPPPKEVQGQLSAYVVGVVTLEGRTTLLLDLDGLLTLPVPGDSTT